jgi:hypothetical protein
MAAVCRGTWLACGWFLGDAILQRCLWLGVLVAEGVGAVLLVAWIFRVDETLEVLRGLGDRLRRKFGKKTV